MHDDQCQTLANAIEDQTFALHTGNLIAYAKYLQGEPHAPSTMAKLRRVETQIEDRLGLSNIDDGKNR